MKIMLRVSAAVLFLVLTVAAQAQGPCDDLLLQYTQYDLNADQQVTSGEYSSVVCAGTLSPCEQAFQSADTNSDGFLSLAEAQAVSSQITPTVFGYVDTNHDGKLSFAEFSAVAGLIGLSCTNPCPGDAQAVFVAMDANSDGVVTFTEYAAYNGETCGAEGEGEGVAEGEGEGVAEGEGEGVAEGEGEGVAEGEGEGVAEGEGEGVAEGEGEGVAEGEGEGEGAGENVAPVIAADPVDLHFSGQWGSFGSEPGQFNGAFGVDTDSAGNVYVADQNNHRVQKFDASGNFIAQWGTGSPGYGTSPVVFKYPNGIAVMRSTNRVYVCDLQNYRIRVLNTDGTWLQDFGSGTPGFTDSPLRFLNPSHVAVDQNTGDLYVADQEVEDPLHDRIRKLNSSGVVVANWGGGSRESTDDPVRFSFPKSVAVDSDSGLVYVTERGSADVRQFQTNGAVVGRWTGTVLGEFVLYGVFGITAAGNGSVCVAESLPSPRVLMLDVDGNYLAHTSGGSGPGEQFGTPKALGTGPDGSFYVTDLGGKIARLMPGTKAAMSKNGSPTPWTAPTLVATDPNPGDTLTWSVSESASHGTATVSGTGPSPEVFDYAPETDWSGLDSFRVQVSDGTFTASVVVYVTVETDDPGVTEWPTASAITYGDSLALSTLSGGAAGVSGTFAFSSSETVPDAGIYPAEVTFTPDNPAYLTVAGTVDVTVNKATPSVLAWPTASEIGYGQPLSDSVLNGGEGSVPGTFAFESPGLLLDLGTHATGVVFTADDAGNYDTVTGSAEVTVNQGVPEITEWPTASPIPYGSSLADSTLTGGVTAVFGVFAFSNPATIPNAGVYSAAMVFLPSDTVHYLPATGTVDVMVEQATPHVSVWPTASAITYGQTLASSTLTGGSVSPSGRFTFSTPDTAPNAGIYPAEVTFTPNNTVNYQLVSGVVNVTVNQAVPTVTAWPTASAITYGDSLADSTLTGGEAETPGVFTFDAPETVPEAGTYAAAVTFTPEDLDNYMPVSGTVDVTVEQATPEVTEWPTASSIVYGETLEDSTLSGGAASVPGAFAFDAPDTAPGLGTYAAAVTFTPEDTVNYATIAGTVDVEVTQATPVVTEWPTATAITYGETLEASTLSGGAASVPGTFAFDAPTVAPDAGTYAAGVTFTPDDTENYAPVSGTVDVLVMQATPEVTEWPTASAIIVGETLEASTLSGGAASVPGAFAFDAPATAPEEGTYTADVTFTPDDAVNYLPVPGTVEVVVNPEDVELGPHAADPDENYEISLTELLRVIQFFNIRGFHCVTPPAVSEDGYVPGAGGDQSCAPHSSDYSPQDWQISLTELLRLIQFFNIGGYHACPELLTEDGYCPGL